MRFVSKLAKLSIGSVSSGKELVNMEAEMKAEIVRAIRPYLPKNTWLIEIEIGVIAHVKDTML